MINRITAPCGQAAIVAKCGVVYDSGSDHRSTEASSAGEFHKIKRLKSTPWATDPNEPETAPPPPVIPSRGISFQLAMPPLCEPEAYASYFLIGPYLLTTDPASVDA